MRYALASLCLALTNAQSVEQLLKEEQPRNNPHWEDNPYGHQATRNSDSDHLKHLINAQVEQAVLTQVPVIGIVSHYMLASIEEFSGPGWGS
jgi:hypothetical protein